MRIAVTETDRGRTALEILGRHLPQAPAAYLRQILRAGKVQCEGTALRAQSLLQEGQTLHLPNSRRLQELVAEEKASALEILYESSGLLAVMKPAGLAVHRGVGHEGDNLTRRVEALIARRKDPYRIAPVHRLDAETSGPVLFAKGRRAAAVLGSLFMEGNVEKDYFALAAGHLGGAGVLNSPVRQRRKLKAAETHWETVSGTKEMTLLSLRLVSGRTHQIRRQLAAAGHPLAGDRRYAGPALPGLERHFLHCWRLALTDPFTGTALELISPLPADLQGVLETAGCPIPPCRPRPFSA